mmetsp:Transcript_143545/g.459072  ORF Transcript_143545/g.459072 Transcript_143545/m.459072 type:complete len:286 (+) Transcript_143545:323-1180(+)
MESTSISAWSTACGDELANAPRMSSYSRARSKASKERPNMLRRARPVPEVGTNGPGERCFINTSAAFAPKPGSNGTQAMSSLLMCFTGTIVSGRLPMGGGNNGKLGKFLRRPESSTPLFKGNSMKRPGSCVSAGPSFPPPPLALKPTSLLPPAARLAASRALRRRCAAHAVAAAAPTAMPPATSWAAPCTGLEPSAPPAASAPLSRANSRCDGAPDAGGEAKAARGAALEEGPTMEGRRLASIGGDPWLNTSILCKCPELSCSLVGTAAVWHPRLESELSRRSAT